MSEESRLKRLGLLHLKDKPQELKAEFQRRIDAFDQRVAQRKQKQQTATIGVRG